MIVDVILAMIYFSFMWKVSHQFCPKQCTCNYQMVNCSSRGLFEIPSPIIAESTTLDMSFNCIGIFFLNSIPETNVEKLIIRHARINQIVMNKKGIVSSLKYLDLSGNPIHQSDIADLSSLRKLQILIMNDCALNHFPRLILPALNYLDISHNFLQSADVPREFETNRQLKTLDISNNKISYVSSQNFRYLTSSIESINLKNNLLMKISDSLLKEKNELIIFLSLANNPRLGSKNILALLGSLTRARRLTELDLCDTNLDLLNENMFEILRYTPLDRLYLDNNPITLIPDRLFHPIHRVKSVSLRNCNMYSLPIDSFRILTDLAELNLDENHIKEFNIVYFLSVFSSIRKLSLGGNSVSFLFSQQPQQPHQKIFTSYLEGLDFSRQNPGLSYIDSGIWKYMPYLLKLDLSGNQLSHCLSGEHADSILLNLISLEELYLDGNNINHLSFDAFKAMKTLKYLSLTQNKIYTFSDRILSHDKSRFKLNEHSSRDRKVLDLSDHHINDIHNIKENFGNYNFSVLYSDVVNTDLHTYLPGFKKMAILILSFIVGFASCISFINWLDETLSSSSCSSESL